MLFVAFVLTFLILWAVVYATLPAVRHIGQALARLITRSALASRIVSTTRERYSNYLPVAAIVIVGALFTIWAGDAFIDLAERVHTNSRALAAVDTSAHDWPVRERTSGESCFVATMTYIDGQIRIAVELTI